MTSRLPIFVLVLVLITLGGLVQTVTLYTDWLWFGEVQYTQVFLAILLTRAGLVGVVALALFVALYANARIATSRAAPDVLWQLDNQLRVPGHEALERALGRALPVLLVVVSLLAGLAAGGQWQTVVGWWYQVPFGVTVPLFDRDVAFFVFTLPAWRLVVGWATVLTLASLVLAVLVHLLRGGVVVLTNRGLRVSAGARSHLLVLAAIGLLVRAVDFWLDRFELVYSARGVVVGATYTDVHARLPVLSALAVLAVAVAAAFALQTRRPGFRLVAPALAILVLVWVVGLGVYPALLQRFRVAPNELAAEGPFIAHNIRMTRQAYGLDRVEARDFVAGEDLDEPALRRNRATVENIRLWDHRPLLRTYGQLQEIRTYYKFVDVDVDRYTLNGAYRQVMLSPRELSYPHLQSRNWINDRLTFTHGYGLVVGPVNRVTQEGLPEFFAWDIPASVRQGFPAIKRPEIYYGELTSGYVIVRTRSQELDYPVGHQNVYTRYAGNGGIPLSSWVRKLALAVRFGELKILLSDDLRPESRVLMHREVAQRVQRVAPFLSFDADPYLVVTGDGRLVWMLDAYTATDRYPYADPTPRVGNYIRNAVKVSIDAYHGAVDFYVADPADPLVRTLGRAFPALFKPLDAMPADLQGHIRYPEALFRIQAQKYATYHMGEPQVFYNREDLWVLPQRTVGGQTEEMEPYYTIMRLPGERKEEFILLTLFNPARRDNMIAWLAARSDPPNYGRLIVYLFPKQRLVYGPRQIDARIDQDPVIARQLSLWNQAGSTVIRGSPLAIPIEQSLLYVEPLYLAASEQGALPQLRRVIVAHGNQIAMEPTLEQALGRVFGGPPTDAARSDATARPPAEAAAAGLGQRAWEIWNRAQEALRRGDLAQYGAEQQRLQETLRALMEGR
jgi:uncharacterized membrane protein (UPF0182 family)